MRKVIALLAALVLLLGVLPVSAAPIADLTALAKYYPENTVFFASIRTDDAYVQELDGLVQQVLAKMPPGMVPPISLKMLLDMGTKQSIGTDFASGVRPLLGNTMAIGQSSDGIGMVVISITDPTAVQNQLQGLAPAGTKFSVEEANGVTIITVPSFVTPITIELTSDAMVVPFGASQGKRLDNFPPASPLNQTTSFNDTLAMLPNGDYDAAVYVNLSDVVKAGSLGSMLGGIDSATLGDLLGAEAAGLTILDNRSAVLDIVENTGDPTDLSKLGIDMQSGGSIDPDFAKYIPADSSLVFHATNFKALYTNMLNIGQTAAKAQGAGDQLTTNLSQAKGLIQAATGLDFDNDILSWMTGDYAFFAHFDTPALGEVFANSVLTNQQPAFTADMVGFGLVVEATDPGKAKALATGLSRALTNIGGKNPNVKFSQEQIGGVDVTVMSLNVNTSPDVAVPVDIIMGANDRVFVLATRPQATAILTGAPGLDTAPAYLESTKYRVNNPTAYVYADPNGMSAPAVITLLAVVGGSTYMPGGLTQQQLQERRQKDADQVRAIFKTAESLFSSSSISTTVTDQGDTVMRVVLTLAP